jgi:hypothetical protein
MQSEFIGVPTWPFNSISRKKTDFITPAPDLLPEVIGNSSKNNPFCCLEIRKKSKRVGPKFVKPIHDLVLGHQVITGEARKLEQRAFYLSNNTLEAEPGPRSFSTIKRKATSK